MPFPVTLNDFYGRNLGDFTHAELASVLVEDLRNEDPHAGGFFTERQLADRMGLHRDTVRKWRRQRSIKLPPHLNFGTRERPIIRYPKKFVYRCERERVWR